MGGSQRALLRAASLLAITAVAYAGVAWCGFIWDDNLRVSENPTLRSLAGLPRIWFELAANKQYYPLVFTSFWIEYRLWGADPLGYHLVNLLLHGTGAILLWRVLLALAVPGAWLAAAVFALHPVHVESVAWISERKNVLSGVFYLASALAYLRQVEGEGAGRLARGRSTPRRSRSFSAPCSQKPSPARFPRRSCWRSGGRTAPSRDETRWFSRPSSRWESGWDSPPSGSSGAKWAPRGPRGTSPFSSDS